MTRQCGSCTKCCEGWLQAYIYGYEMTPGKQCHFLKNKCTIYPDRPEVCKEFKCVWLRDEKQFLPDWMKPNIINQILLFHRLPEYEYFEVVNAGEELSLKMISWLVGEAKRKNINLKYKIGDEVFLIGDEVFKTTEFLKQLIKY